MQPAWEGFFSAQKAKKSTFNPHFLGQTPYFCRPFIPPGGGNRHGGLQKPRRNVKNRAVLPARISSES
jgi:hypothetical protein